MQLYELLFIIIPTVTDNEVEKTIENIIAALKKETGDLAVKNKKSLGRRKFTYSIKHIMEGTYVLIDFEAPAESMQTLNRTLELEDTVLRHIIVKKEIKSTKQLEKEAKLKEEMQQARIADARGKESTPQKKLVQKAEELTEKKGDSAEPVEKLDEKLDEILKREIT